MRREVYRKCSEEVRNLPACSRLSYAQRCCTNIKKSWSKAENVKWNLKVEKRQMYENGFSLPMSGKNKGRRTQ